VVKNCEKLAQLQAFAQFLTTESPELTERRKKEANEVQKLVTELAFHNFLTTELDGWGGQMS
jgi:hypothetical protein